MRTVGAAFHLGATALAAGSAISIGRYQVLYVTYSPNTDVSWSPSIAFALAGALIAIVILALISLVAEG